MRKNARFLITAALALTLAVSAFPVYAAEAGAIVGAPGSGISAGTSAAQQTSAAAATTAAETKSAWESAAALEAVEQNGFVPALPIGDSIFSSPDSQETTAARTTAAETKAAETKAPETTAARTEAPETKAPETTTAQTTAPETTTAQTTAAETTKAAETTAASGTTAAGSAEVVGAAPTEAPSTEAPTEETTTTAAETTTEAETTTAAETSPAVSPETTTAAETTSTASSEQRNVVTPDAPARTGFPAEMATNGDMPDPDSTTGPGIVRAGNSGVKEPTVDTGTAGATDWGSVSEKRERIVRMAESFIGGTYTYGGMSPETGFDCSGLVKYVFKNAAGISLPRTSAEQAGEGQSITASELQPGDLIAYDGSDRDGSVNHISIYVGDGMAVHAVGTGKGIRKTKWDYQPAMTIRNVLGD